MSGTKPASSTRDLSLPVTVPPMDHELQRWCLVPSGAHDWGQHALRVRHTRGFAGPAAGRPHERSGRGWSREEGGRGSDDAGLVPGGGCFSKERAPTPAWNPETLRPGEPQQKLLLGCGEKAGYGKVAQRALFCINKAKQTPMATWRSRAGRALGSVSV